MVPLLMRTMLGALVVVIMALPSEVSAQFAARAPPRLSVPPLVLFPLGLHIGTTGSSDRVLGPRNFTVGGELSVVYFDWLRWRWLGGFLSADALFQSSGAKVALGPELGFWPFGIDAGPIWVRAGATSGWGIQGRFHLTALVSSLYVGVAALGPNATPSERWEPLVEFGLLLKFPMLFWGRLPAFPLHRERGRGGFGGP